MKPSEQLDLCDPMLPVYVPRNEPSMRRHAWKMICGSIGLQLALLLMGSRPQRPGFQLEGAAWNQALLFPAIVIGTVLGVVVGHFADKPRARRGSPSGLRHLFVLILQFALIFAWLKAWGS